MIGRPRTWVICAVLGYIFVAGLNHVYGWRKGIEATSVYLLLLNLGVFWWYAHLTRELANAAREQAQVTADQFDLSARSWEATNQPVAVLERRRETQLKEFAKRLEGILYRVRNIGPGLAVNVYLVEARAQYEFGPVRNVGSLESGGELLVSSDLERSFAAASNRVLRFVLVAEAVDVIGGHRWFTTLNVRTPDGEVHHRVKRSRKDIQVQLDVRDFLKGNWEALWQAIEDFEQEVWPEGRLS